MIDKKKQGRRNKINGSIFERKVREELESIGYVVAKWNNQVDLKMKRMVPSKHKYNFYTKVMSLGSGFPDFIAFMPFEKGRKIIGIECKIGKYLDDDEKMKCVWLLENGVFDAIYVAEKQYEGKKVKPMYVDFTDIWFRNSYKVKNRCPRWK